MKKLFQSSVFGLVSVALLNSTKVYAQTIQPISSNSPSTDDLKIHFQPPRSTSDVADNGTPKSEGTASRSGTCLTTEIPLTVLTGQSPDLTLTASSHPTFFVYVPYTSTQVSYGMFSVYDQETNQEVWNVVFQLPMESGIISIPSPQNKKSLEIYKNYHWFLELNCNNNLGNNQEIVMVKGEVKRVSSQPFEADLKNATPLEKVRIYAKQGLWYDALNLLATLQQDNPENHQFKTLWIELLKASNSKKIERIYQESLVGNIILDF